jgi:DNA polymerase elongation subunit (family B)
MNVWTGLTELSSITNVRIEELYTRGQQTRVRSRLHRACVLENVIMDKSEKEGEEYEGAFVIDPVPGRYEWCFSLDFSSLYPSIIIAYNICYSTFVLTEDPLTDSPSGKHSPSGMDEVPTSALGPGKQSHEVHEIHINDKIYKFLKNPIGIVPSILTSLIEERKITKKKLNHAQGIQKIVLDKRQYALKISANSVYGSFGIKEAGHLTFTEGAACTTAIGREVIKRASSMLSRKGMNVVYGDTDSCIAQNLSLKLLSIKEREDLCSSIAVDLSSHFPPPLKLEFENVFTSFIILSKKRYAAKNQNDVYTFKGVVSARRDGCAFLRTVYSDVLKMILDSKSKDIIYSYLKSKLFDLYLLKVPLSDLVIKRGYNGWYKIASNPQNIFANRLKERGDDVVPGQKLEFVFVRSDVSHALQGEKMEKPDKVNMNDIDVPYYAEKQLMKPIDQLLVLCKMDPFVEAFKEYMNCII